MDAEFEAQVSGIKDAAREGLQPINRSIDLPVYLKLARHLQMSAASAERHSSLETAFLHSYRTAYFILRIVSQHPGYATDVATRSQLETIAHAETDRCELLRNSMRTKFMAEAAAAVPAEVTIEQLMASLPAVPSSSAATGASTSPPTAATVASSSSVPTSSTPAGGARTLQDMLSSFRSGGSTTAGAAATAAHPGLSAPGAGSGRAVGYAALSASLSAPPASSSSGSSSSLPGSPVIAHSRSDGGGGSSASAVSAVAAPARPDGPVAYASLMSSASSPASAAYSGYAGYAGSGVHAAGGGGGLGAPGSYERMLAAPRVAAAAGMMDGRGYGAPGASPHAYTSATAAPHAHGGGAHSHTHAHDYAHAYGAGSASATSLYGSSAAAPYGRPATASGASEIATAPSSGTGGAVSYGALASLAFGRRGSGGAGISISPARRSFSSAPPGIGSGIGTGIGSSSSSSGPVPAAGYGALHAALASASRPMAGAAAAPVSASPYAGLGASGPASSSSSGTGGRAGFVDELRRLTVPNCLLDSFAKIAAPNTVRPPRGIETCGILAGHEDLHGGGGYTVTHLVIPSQRAGADFCEMLNEDQLLEFCLREGLITLGWVHTHPSQDCFMSSLDQHTQCGFQSMLPEAIAIVLAPTDARSPFAIFRLTDDPMRGSGLELIQRCERTGFHPHEAEFQIYETSSHCAWRTDKKLTIVDLRL